MSTHELVRYLEQLKLLSRVTGAAAPREAPGARRRAGNPAFPAKQGHRKPVISEESRAVPGPVCARAVASSRPQERGVADDRRRCRVPAGPGAAVPAEERLCRARGV